MCAPPFVCSSVNGRVLCPMPDGSAEVQVTADWLIIQEVLNLKLEMSAA